MTSPPLASIRLEARPKCVCIVSSLWQGRAVPRCRKRNDVKTILARTVRSSHRRNQKELPAKAAIDAQLHELQMNHGGNNRRTTSHQRCACRSQFVAER